MTRLSVLVLAIVLAGCAPATRDLEQRVPHGAPLDTTTKAAIHAYLVEENPEILMEMSRSLAMKQRAAAFGALTADLATGTAPIAGNPAGSVTVVEFFDIQCPYCKEMAGRLQALTSDDPDVRIIYKDFPILDPISRIGAKASLAAMRQGRYLPLHDALMADPTQEHQLTEAQVMTMAAGAGLDIGRLRADMTDPAIEAQINANIALAQQLRITGTPGLVIGEQIITAALPLDALKAAVAQAKTKPAS